MADSSPEFIYKVEQDESEQDTLEKLVDDASHVELPKLSIIGPAGTGKSLLFNTIIGVKQQEVGQECDLTIKEAQHKFKQMFVIADTPGFGTQLFNVQNTIDALGDTILVVIVLAIDQKFRDQDTEALHHFLQKKDLVCIVVLNKLDNYHLGTRDRKEGGLAKLRQKRANLDKHFGLELVLPNGVLDKISIQKDNFNVYDVKTFDPAKQCLAISVETKLGVTELVEIIYRSFPDAARKAFAESLSKTEIETLGRTQQRAFASIQKFSPKLKHAEAQAVILASAAICGTIGAVPIPFSDILLMTPVQVTMVVTIGKIFHKPVTTKTFLEVVAAISGGLLARAIAQNLIKAVQAAIIAGTLGAGIPAVAALGAVGAGVAASATILMGEAAVVLFTNKKFELNKERKKAKQMADKLNKTINSTEEHLKQELLSLSDRYQKKEITHEELQQAMKDAQAKMTNKLLKDKIVNIMF